MQKCMLWNDRKFPIVYGDPFVHFQALPKYLQLTTASITYRSQHLVKVRISRTKFTGRHYFVLGKWPCLVAGYRFALRRTQHERGTSHRVVVSARTVYVNRCVMSSGRDKKIHHKLGSPLPWNLLHPWSLNSVFIFLCGTVLWYLVVLVKCASITLGHWSWRDNKPYTNK